MRLGILTGEYYPHRGGVGDFTRELALALCRAGHEVHLILPASCAADPSCPLPPSFFLHSVIRRWSFPALLQIRKLTLALALDLLNVQYQALAYGMTLPIHFLPRAAGLPTVVTFHDLLVPYLFPGAGPLRRAAVNMLARSAAGVIVTNPEDEQTLKSQISNLKSRIACIPIGSNIPAAPPPGYDRARWRADMGLRPDEWLVGFFGFLNPSRGGEALLAAIEILLGRGMPLRLVLIGGAAAPAGGAGDPVRAAGTRSGDGEAALHHQMLAPLDPAARLEDRVILTGYLAPPQVSGYLLACDVLALPYVAGATLRSGSLMAGLAHGCPIVTTEPALPLPELAGGENVRLTARDDPLALAEALAEVLTSPELRARLSAGAAALAGQFDWGAIAGRTAAFFREVRATWEDR